MTQTDRDQDASLAAKDQDSLAAAQACLNENRIAEGEAILARLLETTPRDAETRCLAGYAAFLRTDYAGALPHLDMAVDVNPLLFEAQYLRAFVLSGLGRLDETRKAFHRVLVLDPGCHAARVRLCEVLIENGGREEAKACLEEGRRLGMDDETIDAVWSLEPEPPPSGEAKAAGTMASSDPAAVTANASSTPAAATTAATAVPEPSAEVAWIAPRKLLHAGRLDVVAKCLYARALLGVPSTHSGYAAEDVYLRHILFRTGGSEPGDEARKGTLTDFADQFARLVGSMRELGFDPAEPIPVSRRTGLILNGAHRLAAALALNLDRVPVTYRDDVDGLRWGFEWFTDQGFAPEEIDHLLRTWIELQRDRAGCVMLWSPAESRWDEIEGELAARFPVVARRDFEFAPAAFAEMVRDVYATDWGPVVGENIERKLAFFSEFAPQMRFLVVHAPAGVKTLAKIKEEIRERHQDLVPADRFATLHTTDARHETNHVADIFLHPENLAALRLRPEQGLRPEFMSWLADYHAALGRLELNPEDCCVVGSSTLEVLGVRDSTDIDFTVNHKVRRRRFTPGVTHLTPDLDVVSQDYPRAIARPAAPTDDDLIRDRALHFRFRGLKFASLDVVLTRKQTQRRDKDLADVARVGRMRLAGRL